MVQRKWFKVIKDKDDTDFAISSFDNILGVQNSKFIT